jgi:hypothetical protein
LQSVSDSAFGDDRLHDFDDDEFADMPELETITDTDDEVDGHSQPANSVSDDVQYNWIRNPHRSDDDNAPGGSSLPTEELLDSLEGESSEQDEPAMQRQPVPFVQCGFLLSAIQDAKKKNPGKTEPDINTLERNAS